MSLRSPLVGAALLAVSTALALILAEGVCRVLYDPSDYLRPEIVPDAILGRRIRPGSAGHDEWGFRNERVPERADVVAVGDSQTYGHSAGSDEAWPAALARRIGRPVYNLGLGGICPVQYEYLLETRALSLNPEAVVVGFYLGNDLAEASRAGDEAERWEALRRGGPDEWLARNSVLYGRLVRTRLEAEPGAPGAPEGPPARSGAVRALRGPRDSPLRVTVRSDDPPLHAILAPGPRLANVDSGRPEIAAGLATCLDVLARMGETCRDRGVRMIVLLIPSEETVLGPALERVPQIEQRETILAAVEAERRVAATARERLGLEGIEVLDPLDALRRAAERTPVFPVRMDDHYNADGYAVIAAVVAEAFAGH